MSKQLETNDQAEGPKRAGEFLASVLDGYPPEPLFGSCWRDGEMALMFGAAGVGKSLLAVQIADALARGRPVDGFSMPRSRRKVLYVDLGHSDRQFAERYSYRVPVRNLGSVLKACRFAENLYRSRPPRDEDLCEWLAGQIDEHGFKAVIVDDLTALKKTHDGVRETLAAMRKLKSLCDERRVSILAIAGCEGPSSAGEASESDLKRSGVLCGVADSVFAIGRGRGDDARYIVQTRSRNAAPEWTVHNAPSARIARTEKGWPLFVFDERLAEPVDRQSRDAICRIRAMRNAGKTWRTIEAELEIPKTRAVRLLKKWTPEMGEYAGPAANADCGTRNAEFEADDAGSPPYEGGVDSRVFQREDGVVLSNPSSLRPELTTDSGEENHPVRPERRPPLLRKEGSPESSPQPYGPKRVSVYDLKRGFDRDGEEIFIESENEDTGRPKVWYQFNRRGNKVKFTKDNLGRLATNLGPTAYL